MASKRRATLGTVRKHRNQWKAFYFRDRQRHTPGHGFSDSDMAWKWLRAEQNLIDNGEWSPPADRRAEDAAAQAAEEVRTTLTLDVYGRRWIASRITRKGTPLHPATSEKYSDYLEGILKPLAAKPLAEITAADFTAWHAQHAGTPAQRHKAYAFAKSVFKTAVDVEQLIVDNPCRVENAARKPKATAKPDKHVKQLTHDQVRQAADLVRDRDKMLLLLIAYCLMRPGEGLALRRSDLELGLAGALPFGWVTIERGISSYGHDRHEGETKTGELGERINPIPPHLIADLQHHLDTFAQPGPNGLLFPGTNPRIAFRTIQQFNGHAVELRPDGTPLKGGYGWYHARQVLGIPDFKLGWLRHWSTTLWDEAGTPEAIRRAMMGHVQPGMTGHYTHPDTTKASPYAVKVSELAGWTPPAQAAPPPATAAAAPGAGALAAVLAAMDDAQLTATIATLAPEQLAEIIPQLPPARVAQAVAGLAAQQRGPQLRVIDGGRA